MKWLVHPSNNFRIRAYRARVFDPKIFTQFQNEVLKNKETENKILVFTQNFWETERILKEIASLFHCPWCDILDSWICSLNRYS